MANEQIDVVATQIEKQRKGYYGLSLSGMTTTSAPTIISGSVIEVAGSLFQFTSDESINSSSWTAISTGSNAYIYVESDGATAATLTAYYTDETPTWREDYNGYYNSSGGASRYIGGLFKAGTNVYGEKYLYGSEYNKTEDDKITPLHKGIYIYTKSFALYPSNVIVDIIDTPSSAGSGVTTDIEGNIISCDNTSNLIYKHNKYSATVVSSFAGPIAGGPVGIDVIASTGNLLSYSRPSGLYIAEHEGISNNILLRITTGTNISDIAYDPTTGKILLSDFSADRVYVYNGFTSTVEIALQFASSIYGVTVNPFTGDMIVLHGNGVINYCKGLSTTILYQIQPAVSTVAGKGLGFDKINGRLLMVETTNHQILMLGGTLCTYNKWEA
jgi:hypothetical protein